MGVCLPNSVFFHIPKTGGSWVQRSLENTFGKKAEKLNANVGWHDDINGIHIPKSKLKTNKFSFTFVRHPLSWYKSYWKFNYDRFGEFPEKSGNIKWDSPINILVDYCGSTDFNQFIDNVICAFPDGYYHKVVRENEGVDFVGRQENLYFDLCDALDMAGEDYVDKCFLSQHVNVSIKALDTDYTKRQRDFIVNKERYVLEKYYDKYTF